MRKPPTRRLFGEPEILLPVSTYIRAHARNAHVLLWKRRGVYGWAIALHTGGGNWDHDRAHLTMIIRKGDRVYSVGNEEQAGRGALIGLRGEVARNPGVIAVFELVGVTPEQADAIAEELETLCDASYCWSGIVLLAFSQNAVMSGLGWLLSTVPGFRLLARWLQGAAARSDEENLANFCSMVGDKAICAVMGPHYIQKKPSREITPNDFGRSLNTKYLCTLIPDNPPPKKRRRMASVLWCVVLLAVCWGVWRPFLYFSTTNTGANEMRTYGHELRITINDDENKVALYGTTDEGRPLIHEQVAGDNVNLAINALRTVARDRSRMLTTQAETVPPRPAENSTATDPAPQEGVPVVPAAEPPAAEVPKSPPPAEPAPESPAANPVPPATVAKSVDDGL